MTFSEALERVKKGDRLTRSGWNGKDQYIFIMKDIHGIDLDGYEHTCSEAIAFQGTSGLQVGWLASQGDMLAYDWEVI